MAQSLLLIPVPSSDSLIGPWRKKYDWVALHGVPAHITLLFPFKEPSQISGVDIEKLDGIFTKLRQFPFTLVKIGTFPNVIFLEPNPRGPFIELTKKIVNAFPETPPWEGKYPAVNPHQTMCSRIADEYMNALVKEITLEITNKLPINAIAREAWLMISNNGEWEIKRTFRFQE